MTHVDADPCCKPSQTYRATDRYKRGAKALGSRVRCLRHERKLSLYQVAELTGLEFSYLQLILGQTYASNSGAWVGLAALVLPISMCQPGEGGRDYERRCCSSFGMSEQRSGM
jgi:hypothetical protein